MIVFVVNFDRIRSLELERDSPVTADSDRPPSCLPPFKFMEIEAWEAHI
jgi:hypothetical protein